MFNNRKKCANPGDDYLPAGSSSSKVYSCDVTEMVCDKTRELMDSYGYVRDYHVAKYLRDSSKLVQLWLDGGQLGRLDVAQRYYPYVPE